MYDDFHMGLIFWVSKLLQCFPDFFWSIYTSMFFAFLHLPILFFLYFSFFSFLFSFFLVDRWHESFRMKYLDVYCFVDDIILIDKGKESLQINLHILKFWYAEDWVKPISFEYVSSYWKFKGFLITLFRPQDQKATIIDSPNIWCIKILEQLVLKILIP